MQAVHQRSDGMFSATWDARRLSMAAFVRVVSIHSMSIRAAALIFSPFGIGLGSFVKWGCWGVSMGFILDTLPTIRIDTI